MSAQPTTYDLLLLLDPRAEQEARSRALESTRSAIEALGEIATYAEWGLRPLAYQIDHRAEAEYHLFQFHAKTPELLEQLNRSLSIADGVLRFMITKVLPGTPPPPGPPSPPGQIEHPAERPVERAAASERAAA